MCSHVYKRRQEPTTILRYNGRLTDKSDDRVGHLNTILARGGGNFNDPIFKSSNARDFPGGESGEGCWSFESIGA